MQNGSTGGSAGDLNAEAACIAAYCAELTALEGLLENVDNATYGLPCAGKSPIGAHVRHCIDHSLALLNGMAEGLVDYEQRHRDESCESECAVGLAQIAQVRSAVAALTAKQLAMAVQVRCMVQADQPAFDYPSTVLRELLFLLSHQHHHHASIAALAEQQGVAVPPLFALAPSTRAAVLAAQS